MKLKNIVFRERILRPFTGIITLIGLFALELYVFVSAFFIIVRKKRRFDVIYRRHNLLCSEYILSKLFKIPSIREVNGIYADEVKIQKRGDRVSLWLINLIERFSLPKADKIVSVTSKMKNLLRDEYGVPESKIVVNPNGANIDLFKPMDTAQVKRELCLNPDDSYVCFTGHLVKWLGIENLIYSAPLIVEEFPNTKFMIVGNGGLKGELVNLVGTLGLADNFIFTGMVPYEQVPLYVNAADVCVMPAASDFRNNRMGSSPLKLHEYMACGKPVVAGNVEGDVQEIADSGSGLIVDPTNAKEMAGALITLLKNDQMRREMGERARTLVVEKYSWIKNAQQMAEVCRCAAYQYSFIREAGHK